MSPRQAADVLAEAVQDPSYAKAATAAARYTATEDGTGAVVTAVERSAAV
ncbi:hypothetical protein ACFXGI_17025 [Streptomyces sp. NPDC059355]